MNAAFGVMGISATRWDQEGAVYTQCSTVKVIPFGISIDEFICFANLHSAYAVVYYVP